MDPNCGPPHPNKRPRSLYESDQIPYNDLVPGMTGQGAYHDDLGLVPRSGSTTTAELHSRRARFSYEPGSHYTQLEPGETLVSGGRDAYRDSISTGRYLQTVGTPASDGEAWRILFLHSRLMLCRHIFTGSSELCHYPRCNASHVHRSSKRHR
jgi:hypothetical protein